MRSIFARAFSAILVLCIAMPLWSQVQGSQPGQSTDRRGDETPAPIQGFNAYENFRGMVNSTGVLLKLDSTIGYDFNQYIGVFAGVPLYFANDVSTVAGQPSTNEAGAGDVYFGIEAYVPGRIVNYSTSVTGSAPTGSVSKGFSPGQPTIDWSNRFRHRFGNFAPFVVAGLANTVPDSEIITRDFTSLGAVSHFEEGAEYDLTKRVYLGGSAYQIVPFGNQQVFSVFGGVVPRDDNNKGPAAQPPPGNSGQPSASGNDLTQEHGFDAWIGFEPSRIVRLELGFSRSVTFAVNSFSFNVGLNVGRLLHLQH